MSGRLAGKHIVVTGGAGGIGAEAARAFVAEGAVVGLMDRASTALTALAASLGESATALVVDVSDEQSVADAFASWTGTGHTLDVLYCCAGVQLHDEESWTHLTSLDTWNRTFAVNATGVFLSLKHALPLMIDSGGGSVIICGSPTALTMSGGGYTAYASAKAAAMALTRVVAADYARHGIRANTIVPGTIETPLIAPLLGDADRRAELESLTPIGRIGTPDDLVGIAVYLASDESAFATGAVFAVDGGLTHR